ncbi:ABC transporter ATP-binding protein [Porphyromonas pogonae]|uniref:ABC transporter ATP-binding protein n=1 Tax=Porphyromonas pogonae TaxID=867595 RepID=UPI002E79177D|nr:ABC transporter ATP-binding protein [Porphyromonas pogonae]
MQDIVIECKDLAYSYGDRLIYENLSFKVPQGSILGLLGKNGTGKTTTINLLNGYLKPYQGECLLFGEDARSLSVTTRRKVALLLEGHIQYSYMNIRQIERFYAPFYPEWDASIYYELMGKMSIKPTQKICKMSCGQRSQVALGLILAQNADLFILDDFSLGLDPGYRQLFIDYLYDYVKAESKTVFVTSHIIQDMEKFIDDCIILDYGRILLQSSVRDLLDTFHKYEFGSNNDLLLRHPHLLHAENRKGRTSLYSFLTYEEVENILKVSGVEHTDLRCRKLSLEEAFIGLTGKY